MIDHLFGSIWHQGDVYPASVPAIPFLLELAADRETPDRDQILELVTLMAIGLAAENLPYGLPIAGLRRSRSARYRVAVYDAVAERLPTIVPLLQDPDESVAALAAFTVAWFPDQAVHSGPALIAAAADAGRARPVRVNTVLALGMVGQRIPAEPERVFDALLRDDDPVLRWAAAVASVTMTAGRPAPAALAELCTWAAARHSDDVRPWHVERDEWALRLLDRADPDTADVIRTARVRAVLAEPGMNWHNRASSAAHEAFPAELASGRVPYRDLTAAQREFVRGLAARGLVFWPPWDGPGMVLHQRHLPRTRLGLIWYAAKGSAVDRIARRLRARTG
jgi:hypothetical protein